MKKRDFNLDKLVGEFFFKSLTKRSNHLESEVIKNFHTPETIRAQSTQTQNQNEDAEILQR